MGGNQEMAKQKRGQKSAASEARIENQGATLRDRIGNDALEKLKEVSRTMRQEEEQRKAAERERKITEQKIKEKNKSFADLFEESNLDWKKFK